MMRSINCNPIHERENSNGELLNTIRETVIAGRTSEIRNLIHKAIETGFSASQVLNEGLISGMDEVGLRFENGEFFVPEMLVAARTMQVALELLQPLLIDSGVTPIGKVIIGTVQGDLHDIGKNLVGIMLKGAGFDVIDLGTDVSPSKFVEAVQESDVDILAMSALLTTTTPIMLTVIEAMKKAGVRDKVKIMIGGASVTENYAEEICADGFAPDAVQAVNLARALI
jgi:5-methyltetrahydrofolate--homocysteine methyltransferase